MEQTIVRNLIASAPIELKANNPIRHDNDGPAFTLVMVGCITCQKQMKANWIRLQFVEGQEQNWQSDAQAAVDKHVKTFHNEDE
jgi:hypothetical protein